MIQVFNNNHGDFSGFNDACKWLQDNGYSYGSMQGNSPIGVMAGDHNIPKWRNLSSQDIAQLDGRLTGDPRNGPITLTIGWDGESSED
jgi:hypothetical protein